MSPTSIYTPFTLITTPFVQPPSCASLFSTTDLLGYILRPDGRYTDSLITEYNSPLTTLPILVSNTADRRFSACQPSGWDRGDEPFSFRPAVCPSGWIMYNAAALDQYWDHLSSAAYCCASGYTLNSDYHLLGSSSTLLANTYLRCLSSIPGPPTTVLAATSATTTGSSDDSTPTPADGIIQHNTLYPAGIALHNPYRIQWRIGDLASLSPSPPTLPCDATLATWTPGSPAPTDLPCSPYFEDNRRSSNSGSWSGVNASALWFCVIGLPLIAFFGILGCIGCCCYSRNKKEEEKRLGQVKEALRAGVIYTSLEEARKAAWAAQLGQTGMETGEGREREAADTTRDRAEGHSNSPEAVDAQDLAQGVQQGK